MSEPAPAFSTAEFSYTVGLTEHGLPELIVTGLRTDQASQLLHHWAPYLLDENVVLPGETLESGPWLMEAVEVALPGEHLLLATRLYGEVVRGLQLVCADGRDRWPWDPGHRTRRGTAGARGAGAPLIARSTSPAGSTYHRTRDDENRRLFPGRRGRCRGWLDQAGLVN